MFGSGQDIDVISDGPIPVCGLQLVKDLLSKTVGAELAKALLDREIPGQVHFANPM